MTGPAPVFDAALLERLVQAAEKLQDAPAPEQMRVELDSDELALLVAQASPDALRRLARALGPLVADDLLIRLLSVLRDEGR